MRFSRDGGFLAVDGNQWFQGHQARHQRFGNIGNPRAKVDKGARLRLPFQPGGQPFAAGRCQLIAGKIDQAASGGMQAFEPRIAPLIFHAAEGHKGPLAVRLYQRQAPAIVAIRLTDDAG